MLASSIFDFSHSIMKLTATTNNAIKPDEKNLNFQILGKLEFNNELCYSNVLLNLIKNTF